VPIFACCRIQRKWRRERRSELLVLDSEIEFTGDLIASTLAPSLARVLILSLPIEQVHANRIGNVFMISTVIFERRQLQDLREGARNRKSQA
jgi:hypothetical protein